MFSCLLYVAVDATLSFFGIFMWMLLFNPWLQQIKLLLFITNYFVDVFVGFFIPFTNQSSQINIFIIYLWMCLLFFNQTNKYFYGYYVWVLVGFFYSSNKSTFTRNNSDNLFYKQLFYQYIQVYNVVNQLSWMWMCPGEWFFCFTTTKGQASQITNIIDTNNVNITYYMIISIKWGPFEHIWKIISVNQDIRVSPLPQFINCGVRTD